MNLVDSSGWLEYASGSSSGKHFRQPIHALSELVVPSVVLFEVFKKMLLVKGEREALRVSAHMLKGHVVPLDAALALDAAYFSKEYGIAMADSIIYATAKMKAATIWTQDADFKGLENVKYFPKKS